MIYEKIWSGYTYRATLVIPSSTIEERFFNGKWGSVFLEGKRERNIWKIGFVGRRMGEKFFFSQIYLVFQLHRGRGGN